MKLPALAIEARVGRAVVNVKGQRSAITLPDITTKLECMFLQSEGILLLQRCLVPAFRFLTSHRRGLQHQLQERNRRCYYDPGLSADSQHSEINRVRLMNQSGYNRVSIGLLDSWRHGVCEMPDRDSGGL